MKQKILSMLISMVFSLCLIVGSATAQDFALYVLATMNILAWAGVLFGLIKDEAAKKIVQHAWISCISTALQIYALIHSGHPALAASCFLVSFFIVVTAVKAVKSADDDSGRPA